MHETNKNISSSKKNTLLSTLLSFMKARKYNQTNPEEITHRAYGSILQGNFSISKADMKGDLSKILTAGKAKQSKVK